MYPHPQKSDYWLHPPPLQYKKPAESLRTQATKTPQDHSKSMVLLSHSLDNDNDQKMPPHYTVHVSAKL